MTALTTRDALAKALYQEFEWSGCNGARWELRLPETQEKWRQNADAMFASGAVTDADTLADDETLVEAIAADQKEAADSWGDPLPGTERLLRARTVLHALAAALTERGAQ